MKWSMWKTEKEHRQNLSWSFSWKSANCSLQFHVAGISHFSKMFIAGSVLPCCFPSLTAGSSPWRSKVNCKLQTRPLDRGHMTSSALRFPMKNLVLRCLLTFTHLTPLQPGGRVLPYKRLMGMCRRMGSHFYHWIDYNRVAFSIDLLEWGRTFPDFLG